MFFGGMGVCFSRKIAGNDALGKPLKQGRQANSVTYLAGMVLP